MAEPAPAPDLEVIKLTPTIGAEIQGIDLRHTPGAALTESLRGLLVQHKVIFFRDQDLTREQHLAFARCFGDLELFPFSQGRAEGSCGPDSQDLPSMSAPRLTLP